MSIKVNHSQLRSIEVNRDMSVHLSIHRSVCPLVPVILLIKLQTKMISYSSTLGRIFALLLLLLTVTRKFIKGALGFEPRTSRSAVECSTTELHPLIRKLRDYMLLILIVLLFVISIKIDQRFHLHCWCSGII